MSQTCDTTRWQHDRSFVSAEATAVDTATVVHATILAICLAVLACAAVLTPSEDGLTLFGHRWPFACRLYETFGIRCALCGMSRSFCALAHSDLAAGLQFHRLGPVVFALFALQIPYRLYALVAGPERMSRHLRRLHAGLVCMIGLAVFVNWFVYLGGLLL